MKAITRTVWILSFISLFNDIASESLYPVMPIYLKHIGFSVLLIGILEGIAEATAGLSKGYFGKWSDNTGKRIPFVRIGYALSAIAKPMLGVITHAWWVLLSRCFDKLGKGVRTAARDALLSDEATAQNKGRVFGLHRAMDTLGAVIGPTAALIFLFFYPGHYKALFLLGIIPGAITFTLTFLIKDKHPKPKENVKRTSLLDFVRYWKIAPAQYRKLVIGLLLFTLFNSSDVFLLLKMKNSGVSDLGTVGVYVFYNIFYAIASYPLGVLADKVGMKKVLVFGFLLFAIVYFGMGINNNAVIFYVLFLLYGVYMASTEGVYKAWVSNLVSRNDTATAIGTLTAFQSVATMLASSIAGFIWYRFGAAATFIITGAATLLVVVYFIFLPKPKEDLIT